MTVLWDTSLVSRLQPSNKLLDYALGQALNGVPVRVAAPAILEVVYGYQLRLSSDPRYRALLGWLGELVDAELLTVIPLDGRAALIAGRIRGVHPHPPGPRKAGRSKTMNQASWLLDIQIASTAYAAGLDVATENRRDFQHLSDALTLLFPAAPAMAVHDAPL